jgi:hypothetical protein
MQIDLRALQPNAADDELTLRQRDQLCPDARRLPLHERRRPLGARLAKARRPHLQCEPRVPGNAQVPGDLERLPRGPCHRRLHLPPIAVRIDEHRDGEHREHGEQRKDRHDAEDPSPYAH